ncbi:MAG: UDP-N-acetylmuramate dehydrogenase [Planctomycetota bacterium]
MAPLDDWSWVRRDVPLATKTTWGIGGSARYFAEPPEGEVPALVAAARDAGLPLALLGKGSNTLAADGPIDAVVCHLGTTHTGLRVEGDRLVAAAGVPLPKLSRFAANAGYAGFEFLVGIPGNVGGGVAMNAGTVGYEPRCIADVLDRVAVVDAEGATSVLPAEALGLTYRRSAAAARRWVVTAAWFRVPPAGDPEPIRRRTREHLEARQRTQPLDRRTAGSVFKNPPGGRSAGQLIDEAGLRGHRLGGARVSPVHANWIENVEAATAADVEALIAYVQQVVAKRSGLELQTEVTRLGDTPPS